MNKDLVAEVAERFARLIECGEAKYDGSGLVLFTTTDPEGEEEILDGFKRRCAESTEFMEAAFLVMNGALVFAQKMKAAVGEDLTSDLMRADLIKEEDDAT